jgi:hypothetical protein
MRRAAFVLAVTVVALAGCAGGGDIPYTSQQMTNADIKCDAEVLRDTLVGAASRSHADCLRERLPKLSRQQVVHLTDTIEAARDAEQG